MVFLTVLGRQASKMNGARLSLVLSDILEMYLKKKKKKKRKKLPLSNLLGTD